MTIKQILEAFVWLGKTLNDYSEYSKQNPNGVEDSSVFARIDKAVEIAYFKNGWFTKPNVLKMFQELSKSLTLHSLESWISNYPPFLNNHTKKRVGIIMAGNIPLVGFHDFLCVLVSGNIAVVKMSSDDEVLPKLLIDLLIEQYPDFSALIELVEGTLPFVDAVIATGSNNSARYFEYYFAKYPHIIRKSRNSVAVLNGSEPVEELQKLGVDIFQYFGLGCRNVSKLFVPRGYNFDNFFKAIFAFSDVINNKKYANNYEYNRAIYLLNKEQFLDNNFLILKESGLLGGPVSVLFYEFYENEADLALKLNLLKENLQCVLSSGWYPGSVLFGNSQCPQLNDYADGVDTLKFLINLNSKTV